MGEFRPLNYSPGIIKKFKVIRLTNGQGSQLMSYNSDKGLYIPDDSLIMLEAQRQYGKGTKKQHVLEIMDAVRRNSPFINPFSINNPREGIIIFRNGVLSIGDLVHCADLSKVALKGFSPNWLYTIGIPHNFRPDGTCPNFDSFVGQILPPEAHQSLKQLLGYLLIPSAKYRKFFVFVGSGANGKSTLIEVIVEILGHDNVSHESLHNLASNRFAVAEVYGKLANIYADLDSGDIGSSGLLKLIVSGDPLQYERKFKDPFKAPMTARLLFSANKIPIIKEESKAIQDRLIILEFPYRFEEDQQDKELLNRLTTEEEIEGIIAQWALPGLQSLLTNHKFDIPVRSQELLKHYRKQSDPFSDFADQHIEVASEAYVSKAETYKTYQQWCDQSGISQNQQLSQREFSRRIQESYNIPYDEFRAPGTRERAWKGIQLKVDGEIPR
jgi:putative DNA primase/helicase